MTCRFYLPWTEVSDLLKSSQCHMWDEVSGYCEMGEKQCPKPWEKKEKPNVA